MKTKIRKTLDVLAVGALNVDLIIHGDAPREINQLLQWVGLSRVEICPAGSVGYCAVDLVKLGLKVALFSTVADDLWGKWLVEQLKNHGINTSAISCEKDKSSGIGIYLLLFGSKKRPLTGRRATNQPWPKKISASVDRLLKQARVLHCGGYLHYSEMWGAPTETLFQKAKQYGLITSLDSQFPLEEVEKPWLKHLGNLPQYLDIIFTDEQEAEMITHTSSPEHSAKILIDTGIKMVVIKMGEKGAIFRTKEQMLRQPAFKTEQVTDSIGAGDAFDAGVIYGVLKGWDLKKIAQFASGVATLTLKGIGGIQSAPSVKEVSNFLRRQNIQF